MVNLTAKYLEQFRAKARCYWSQRRANQLRTLLDRRLTPGELRAIDVAWDHVRLQEGNDELDAVIDRIVSRYS